MSDDFKKIMDAEKTGDISWKEAKDRLTKLNEAAIKEKNDRAND